MLSNVANEPSEPHFAKAIEVMMQALQGKVESITITTKIGDAERSVTVRAKDGV